MLTTIKPKAPSRPLLNAADLDIPYPMSVIGVTRGFAQNNRDAAERLLRACVQGAGMMVYDKDRAIKILAEYLRRSDPVFLEETYTLVRNYTERLPRVATRSIPVLMELEQIKGIDQETLAGKAIDNSIVEQLMKEQFIGRLFGKDLR